MHSQKREGQVSVKASLECDLDFNVQIKPQLERIALPVVLWLLLLHHLLLLLLHLHLLLLPGLVWVLHLLHRVLLLSLALPTTSPPVR